MKEKTSDAARGVAAYIDALEPDRKEKIQRLVALFETHLPEGFALEMQYRMPSFVVPHRLYAKGYHVDPAVPLPFLSVASQKGHIAVYHMGLYASPDLLHWFNVELLRRDIVIDMGKSCLRFKPKQEHPYELLSDLAKKMTPAQWIAAYETQIMEKPRR